MRPGTTAEPVEPGVVLSLPVLDGDGIRLRPWRGDDAADLAAAWNDPLIAAATRVPDDRSAAAAARWIGAAARRARRMLAVDLAVVDPDDGRVLGEVGLAALSPLRRRADIGWWTAPSEQGRGVASAAVRCFASWALSSTGIEVLIARIGHGNEASLAVARSAGFEELAPSSPSAPAVLQLRRPAPTISGA